jgi:hypothetical protein
MPVKSLQRLGIRNVTCYYRDDSRTSTQPLSQDSHHAYQNGAFVVMQPLRWLRSDLWEDNVIVMLQRESDQILLLLGIRCC